MDERFEEAAPILAAFSLFDPCQIPDKTEQSFKKYGEENIGRLWSHFLADSEEAKTELAAEWMSYKNHILVETRSIIY